MSGEVWRQCEAFNYDESSFKPPTLPLNFAPRQEDGTHASDVATSTSDAEPLWQITLGLLMLRKREFARLFNVFILVISISLPRLDKSGLGPLKLCSPFSESYRAKFERGGRRLELVE